jgi:hypothetical protein
VLVSDICTSKSSLVRLSPVFAHSAVSRVRSHACLWCLLAHLSPVFARPHVSGVRSRPRLRWCSLTPRLRRWQVEEVAHPPVSTGVCSRAHLWHSHVEEIARTPVSGVYSRDSLRWCSPTCPSPAFTRGRAHSSAHLQWSLNRPSPVFACSPVSTGVRPRARHQHSHIEELTGVPVSGFCSHACLRRCSLTCPSPVFARAPVTGVRSSKSPLAPTSALVKTSITKVLIENQARGGDSLGIIYHFGVAIKNLILFGIAGGGL